MLKGLHPALSPPLLLALAEMGHGDEVALVDANFPAASVARRAVVRLDGSDAVAALEAVLTLLPLDDFVPAPAAVMADPSGEPPVVAAFRAALAAAEGRAVEVEALDRFAFYDRARAAHAVVATGERRLYGNILLRKGVVRP